MLIALLAPGTRPPPGGSNRDKPGAPSRRAGRAIRFICAVNKAPTAPPTFWKVRDGDSALLPSVFWGGPKGISPSFVNSFQPAAGGTQARPSGRPNDSETPISKSQAAGGAPRGHTVGFFLSNLPLRGEGPRSIFIQRARLRPQDPTPPPQKRRGLRANCRRISRSSLT